MLRPIKKTLDDFDFSFQPFIDKRQIDELATMRFLENWENVVFLGPPGVGKTHLASALGLVAAQQVWRKILCKRNSTKSRKVQWKQGKKVG